MPLYQPNDIILNGKYRIEKLLGTGAFGEVYLATHVELNIKRAVKVLHRNMPGAGTSVYTEYLERFRQEAQIGARLTHENLVQVHDFEQAEDSLHLVMEYAPGGSLGEKLEKAQKAGHPISVAESIAIIKDIARGLAVLHENQIVHRDLKPNNILFDKNGRAKVADLGLAQIPGGASMRSRFSSMAEEHPGTPAYMSPEQENTNKVLRPSSDIYALGLIWFEILSGKNYNLLMPGTSIDEFCTDVKEEVKNLIAEMLEEEPRSRPWDGEKLLIRLRQIEQEQEQIKQKQAEQQRREKEDQQQRIEEEQRRERREKEENLRRLEEVASQKQEEEARLQQIEEKSKIAYHSNIENKRGEYRIEAINEGQQTGGGRPESKKRTNQKIKISDKLRIYFMVGVLIVGTIWILVANNLPKTGISTPSEAIGQETTESSNQASQIQSTDTPANTATARPTATKIRTKTITPTKEKTLGIGSTKISDKDGMEMVYVPAGSFIMGGNGWSEHEVNLDGYWIDKYEVTNSQYAQCVAAGDCAAPGYRKSSIRGSYYGNSEYDDYPVIYVSWYDARDYCQWAGGELPTEAQWEKAARGTDGRRYPWGNEPPNSTLSNYDRNVGDTKAVGSYPKGVSPYGAMDMAGNVYEWVNDWYSASYYSVSPVNNPPGPTTGTYKVFRGGSWQSFVDSLHSASRSYQNPGYRFESFGFRCAISP